MKRIAAAPLLMDMKPRQERKSSLPGHPPADRTGEPIMKRPHLRPYVSAMFAGAGAIILSILFFFFIYRYSGVFAGLSRLIGILMPFIYGGAFAYLLRPICALLETQLGRLFPKEEHARFVTAVSVTGSMIVGALVVYALCIMIIPQLVSSLIALVSSLTVDFDQLLQWAHTFFQNNSTILSYIDSLYLQFYQLIDSFADKVLPYLENLVGMLSTFSSSVLSVVTVIKNLFIGLIVAVYFLSSRKRFAQQGKLLIYSAMPESWANIVLEEIAYADRMFSGFINGKLLDSAIIGVLCYIVCVVVKFPNPLLVSAIIGLTNIIPFFGPFIGAVPATIFILIEDPLKAIWFIVFVLILQQVDGNIIGPKILGNTTGLSSFWVLFSLLLFGGLWGFVGLLIGVPLFAVVYDIIKKLVARGLRERGLSDMMNRYNEEYSEDPLPAAPEAPAQNEDEA